MKPKSQPWFEGARRWLAQNRQPEAPARRSRASQSPHLPTTSVSSFNPALPEDASLIVAAELRDQFNGLHDDIQARATQTALTAAVNSLNADIATRATVAQVDSAVTTAISGTSNNSNGVSTLNMSADVSYNQWQLQQVADKIDELIQALRRGAGGKRQ